MIIVEPRGSCVLRVRVDATGSIGRLLILLLRAGMSARGMNAKETFIGLLLIVNLLGLFLDEISER